MTVLHRIGFWGETHHPKWMDIVRIGLGLFLIYKGVQFAQNYTVLMSLMPGWMSFGSFSELLVGHYIVGAHILGGVLLTLGWLTRAACIMQIPVLLGAVFLGQELPDVMLPFSNLFLAIIVLLLLIYFLIAGNGTWSFDAMHVGEAEK
ncbi:DoxX family protein [Niabella ginsenosidivorans]|uniref:DoxX family protein n=1 Tax=Niabella ginsenosidivorans TaxID=1176587 RepID=A0A1A9I2K8_9BACT|nr:DoxX family protein [Niabella ginsenosidivorans]ANH81565.1 DoxX family protein [Niabella ginsenosidivorans]